VRGGGWVAGCWRVRRWLGEIKRLEEGGESDEKESGTAAIRRSRLFL